MKLKTILTWTAILSVIYYFASRKKAMEDQNKPGLVSDLVDGMKEEIKKPLSEVAKDIPGKS